MADVKGSVNAAVAANGVANILVNQLLVLVMGFRNGTLSAEEFVGSVAASGIQQHALLGEIDHAFFVEK